MTDFRAWVATLPAMRGAVRVTDSGLSEGGVCREIVLDSPETRNAITPRMMVELADAVEGAGGAVRVVVRGAGGTFCSGGGGAVRVVVRGAGGTFCSGGDLALLKEHLGMRGSGRVFGGFMQRVALGLKNLPSVAVVEGIALGGGAELALACATAVVQPGAKIGFVQAKLGVSPGFGGGRWLVERLGAAGAARVLKEARILSGEEAVALGLVADIDGYRAVGEQGGEIRVDPMVGPEALTGMDRIVAAAGLDREAALAEELEVFAGLWGGPAHVAALMRAGR